MTEDHLWNVHLLFCVNLDGDTFAIVADGDLALLAIDPDPDLVHVLVVLLVVGSIDQDLIEYLVETRDKADLAMLHQLGLGVENPHWLLSTLNRADVCVWTFENVLQLSELLVLVRVVGLLASGRRGG